MANMDARMVWGVVLLLAGAASVVGCEQQELQSEAAATVSPAQASSAAGAADADAVATDPAGAELAPPDSATSVLGVDAFMRSTPGLEQPVTVEGVVSAVAADSQTLALIDRTEFEQCNMLSCAKLTLPVRWAGEMPELGHTVRVIGRVEDRAGGKVFVGRALTAAQAETP